MLTKILQKFVIDFLKVCQIGDIKTAQQLGFFLQNISEGLSAASSAECRDIKQGSILFGHVFISWLPAKAQTSSHFVLEQLFAEVTVISQEHTNILL